MGSSMISTSEKETWCFLEEEDEEAGDDRLMSPIEAVDESKFKDLAEELRDEKDMVQAARLKCDDEQITEFQ
jgi:hypothetical protein